ncbi:MAG: hypothetical protein K6A69_04770 [Lachnospiraceae bacterium]|nr:hypothetical protein [Lachnospiraceae bacterium]
MNLTDRMLKGTKDLDKEQKRKKNNAIVEEDEMGYAYMDAPKWGYLNENKGVFANDDDNSINTMKSVFDRTAVFHTNSGDQGE